MKRRKSGATNEGCVAKKNDASKQEWKNKTEVKKEREQLSKLNPKTDLVFKKLFGSEENKDILISFINAVLDRKPEITSVEIKNPYNSPDYMDQKLSILDIKAKDENGVWYDIEIQNQVQSYYDKRALYYWAKVYADQIGDSEDFDELRKTIGINILVFKYLPEEEYHNEFRIYNTKSQKQFSDMLELHFIELPKFTTDLKNIKTAIDRWTTVLSRSHKIDEDNIPEELRSDKEICKAIQKLDIMNFEKKERMLYEGQLKWLKVRKAEMDANLTIGMKEGMKEGMNKKALEIARKLLESGLSLGQIAESTSLRIDEIESLKIDGNK